MVDRETTRTIVGIVGNVISLLLFLSPAPTFYGIWKAKSVQSFKPDPYIATVLNCAMWVFYGLPFVHADSLLVLTINSVGFVIELIYLILFSIYSDWPKRRKIIVALLVEIVFMVVVVVITLLCLHGTKSRSMLVGIICVVMNIAMYAAPLTVMKRVIKNKSVRYMPFYLSLGNFANGVIWFAYAFLKIDPYVLIPNALGTLSGLCQLILYATYYKTTNWDNDDRRNQPEVELQTQTASSTNQV